MELAGTSGHVPLLLLLHFPRHHGAWGVTSHALGTRDQVLDLDAEEGSRVSSSGGITQLMIREQEEDTVRGYDVIFTI